ncbi:Uncharacterized protein, DUF1786 family [Thermanaeromonas toyohensis ToBE]|uniref:Uncharacterized protein, DUF1786 family n=1 Tax=Thermanaeromonas toyohensis ToBE TaxID=698762 RepID=A0A1W1W228_9FIRM|nr:DUF1786 domain-containing protein [Thermanaeromonas toyohensis]SMB99530.1 Uncharacterized protein, DUF1786 family [Thermanaeromonas toyohensis ToBE]
MYREIRSEVLMSRPVLAIDIGGGTQDIFLYTPGLPVEGCVQLVLPSPTVIAARQVKEATARRKPLWLRGSIMGGGAVVEALRSHLEQGLPVYAEPQAAKTVHNNLEVVLSLGIRVGEKPPGEADVVETRDLDIMRLNTLLKAYKVELPPLVLVAAQDHGEAPPGVSNRAFRFQYWRDFVEAGGHIQELLYREPPSYFTRLVAIRDSAPAGYEVLVMDTCAAAIWGALADPQVKEWAKEGVTVLNMGNQHTVGVLLKGQRVWGLFEHHTALVDKDKLARLVKGLQEGQLTHEEVFADGGHGCFIDPHFQPREPYLRVAVIGPQRERARGLGYYEAVPYGNMMLAGCFGLCLAFLAKEEAQNEVCG